MKTIDFDTLFDGIDPVDLVKACSPYIPAKWKPLPLQIMFAILPNVEILYGGSAGGAKSEALLFAANQYTHIPGYQAIIYRKSYQDLIRPGALLDRALNWYAPWLGREIKYRPSDHSFHFPSGAKLVFGHMGRKGASDTMQGAEYHFVGIDEITQHTESDALYALSRLRRKTNEDIPLRARFTANPGGIGHRWVYKRFEMVKNKAYDKNDPHSPMYIGAHPKRLFIPSRLADNPYIDQKSYHNQLSQLDPMTRSRLLEGDWSAAPFGRFKPEWFKRYTINGPFVNCDFGPINFHQFYKFATIDVAASFTEGVGGRQFYTSASDATDVTNADPCWTVCTVFGIYMNKMFILDVHRVQTEIPEVFKLMSTVRNKWGNIQFAVEKNGVGAGVAQGAARLGFMVEEIWTTKDKIINSYDAANLAEQGGIYIPARNKDDSIPAAYAWLEEWEGEVFSWMGLKDETSDQVDSLATGAKKVAHYCLNRSLSPLSSKSQPVMPRVHGLHRDAVGFDSPTIFPFESF